MRIRFLGPLVTDTLSFAAVCRCYCFVVEPIRHRRLGANFGACIYFELTLDLTLPKYLKYIHYRTLRRETSLSGR
jgi:hypothetical protein